MNLLCIFILLVGAILSGILYHLGGMGGAWWKNTKVRDVGCPVVALVVAKMIFGAYIGLTFFLLWGALTQYWKFGKPDCKWYHWLFHGIGCGLAWLPVAWLYDLWAGLAVYTVALAIGMCLWSEWRNDVAVEEWGRGALIILLLPLLFML